MGTMRNLYVVGELRKGAPRGLPRELARCYMTMIRGSNEKEVQSYARWAWEHDGPGYNGPTERPSRMFRATVLEQDQTSLKEDYMVEGDWVACRWVHDGEVWKAVEV